MAYLCILDDNKFSIQVVAYSTDELLLDGEIAFLIFKKVYWSDIG